MAHAVRLRSYRPEDLATLVRLDALCFASSFRFSAAAMRRFIEAENAWTCLVVDGQQTIGFCIVHLERTPGTLVGYLVTIDVAKEYRRQGVGELLLKEAETWLNSSGASAMMLHVSVDNIGAIGFYERAGYRRGGEEPGFYGPGIDAAFYWKRIQS